MALSNHMLFLMVAHPYQLPGVVRGARYKDNVMYYETVWWFHLKYTKEGTMKLSRPEIVRKIAQWQLLADRSWHIYDQLGDHRPAYADGGWLAGMLLCNRWRLPAADVLQVVAGVWVEMLCYASHHCGQESHATKLSTGGEFINAVWLVMGHAALHDRNATSAEGLTLDGGLRLSRIMRLQDRQRG